MWKQFTMLPLRLLLLPFCFLHVATADLKLPLVINTWPFIEANKAAWQKLQHQSALDALVEGCTTCERLQCDRTVGFGGSPDENGETTLDAMIMDGANMNMGAVAGLRGIKDASKVARHVLEYTQHSLLVGEAASNFAEMMGFPRETLTTAESKAVWKKWHANNCQPNFWLNVKPNARQSCGPYRPLQTQSIDSGARHVFDAANHDTIGMIVIDKQAHIVAGTSSNGAKHKIPGRVGDSPIPGGGAYADNEAGAAVATGDGDVMMRFGPSLLAVEAMRRGETPNKAAQMAMQRILRFYPKFSGGLVAVDRFGNYGAACAGMQQFPFTVAHGAASAESRVEYVKCLGANEE